MIEPFARVGDGFESTSVGMALPDESGERAWVDVLGTGIFDTREVVDADALAEFMAWALNELHAGNVLYSSPHSHPHDLQPYRGRPVTFVSS